MDLFWILIIFLNVVLMIMFYGLAQFFRRILYKNETIHPTGFDSLHTVPRRQNSLSSVSTISSQILNHRRNIPNQELSTQISTAEPPPSYDEIDFGHSVHRFSVGINSVEQVASSNSSINRHNDESHIQEESVGRFPLCLTRGRVLHHPNQINRNASHVTTQISNDYSCESVHSNHNHMQISIIQSSEESYRSENNQISFGLNHTRSPSNNIGISNQSRNPNFFRANFSTPLRDGNLPPSYAEATNSVPETT